MCSLLTPVGTDIYTIELKLDKNYTYALNFVSPVTLISLLSVHYLYQKTNKEFHEKGLNSIS